MTESTIPMGGSEIAYTTLISKLSPEFSNKNNLILSFCSPAFVDPTKKNIVWQQLNWNEENVALMANEEYVNSIDYFAWVSHWQYDRFRTKFNVPAYKSVILKNATHPVSFTPRSKTGKLKLIYTSTPWRGLDIVLDAFRQLNRDDIELDVFSSSRIYGKKFEDNYGEPFEYLYDIARNMKNVNYHGFAPNNIVREYVRNAHIFAYPSTFEETSCISAIEALTAGCKVVTTNYGALPETCGDWATYVPYGHNRQVLSTRFAISLNSVINSYWEDITQELIIDQNKHYNKFWTWDYRVSEWNKFLSTINE